MDDCKICVYAEQCEIYNNLKKKKDCIIHLPVWLEIDGYIEFDKKGVKNERQD